MNHFRFVIRQGGYVTAKLTIAMGFFLFMIGCGAPHHEVGTSSSRLSYNEPFFEEDVDIREVYGPAYELEDDFLSQLAELEYESYLDQLQVDCLEDFTPILWARAFSQGLSPEYGGQPYNLNDPRGYWVVSSYFVWHTWLEFQVNPNWEYKIQMFSTPGYTDEAKLEVLNMIGQQVPFDVGTGLALSHPVPNGYHTFYPSLPPDASALRATGINGDVGLIVSVRCYTEQ